MPTCDGARPSSLPTLGLLGANRPAALTDALRQCPPDRVVELSGVAKRPHAPLIATLLVYRALYQDSLRCGDRLWVMAIMPALRTTLGIVAPGAITISPLAVPMRDGYPDLPPHLHVHPAWGRVDTLTAVLHAAADAADEAGYQQFLRVVATFMDDEPGAARVSRTAPAGAALRAGQSDQRTVGSRS